MENKALHTVKIKNIKHWSPVWIIPFVTALIGIWIIFSHMANQGHSFMIITDNADGITAGRTTIKNRSVDVGIIERVNLNSNFDRVLLKARMKKGMESLLKDDTVFWVVKPKIGRNGISGLGALFSGNYIEIAPGTRGDAKETYQLLDQEPVSSPSAKGVRINIESKLSGVLSVGAPVLFRGVTVGKIEQARFDPEARMVFYEVFIPTPYDILITENIRFWLDNGISLEVSTQGVHLGVPSLDALIGGGISFDIPEGAELGKKVSNSYSFILYDGQSSIQDSQYTDYKKYLLLFSDSIVGLSEGAPVKFRGIRIGTVAKVPFLIPEAKELSELGYRIPVLIHIEKGRLKRLGQDSDFIFEQLISNQKNGLRAALKSANLLTGSMYVDLNFYQDEKQKTEPDEMYGYPTIATVSSGLGQIQDKVLKTLDRINKLPFDGVMADLRKTLQDTQKTINSLNRILSSKEAQKLPKETHSMIKSLNNTLKGFQPGSALHKQLLLDIKQMEELLRELKPIAKTLNEKSNALVFDAKEDIDIQPKKAKGK